MWSMCFANWQGGKTMVRVSHDPGMQVSGFWISPGK
jgi:hypothetical protein